MRRIASVFTLIYILVLAGCATPPTPTSVTVDIPTALSVTTVMPAAEPTPAATDAPGEPTLQPAFPLAGRWEGKARNGDVEFDVSIDLFPQCALNNLCGSFEIPVVPCAGNYVLSGEQGGVYSFRVTEKSATCGEGSDTLELLVDGKLKFISTGDFGKNEGILQRANMPKPLPVILDDDGSPDGTVALLYLLSDPAVSVEGVVISHGEARPQVYIQHIGRILADWGYGEIPLGAGADKALVPGEDFPDWLRDTADNFWGFAKAGDNRTFPVQNGAELMVKLLKDAEEPLAVFVSGPCTDLALALRQDPSIKDKILGVYIMGGAVFTKGNLTDFSANPQNTSAEWNIYIDPLAAAEVLQAGVPVTLVPLDATNMVSATMADTKAWRAGDEKADLAADFYDNLLGGDPSREFMLWDVMTAAVMVHPELCPMKPLRLEVNTSPGDHDGQTVVIGVGEPNAQVCLNPDADGIRERLRMEFVEE